MSIIAHSHKSDMKASLSSELAGFTEASSPPREHDCDREMVDVTLNTGEIVLMCFECATYWHTGMQEPTNCRNFSFYKLIDAAEQRYAMRAA